MLRRGCPGLRGMQQRWQNNCSIDLQFASERRPSRFHTLSCSLPMTVLALAMWRATRATSSSHIADFESVLPK